MHPDVAIHQFGDAHIYPPVDLVIRPAARGDLPRLGTLGTLLVAEHHAFDPQRFFAASDRTLAGYAAFISSQLDEPDAVVLVAEDQGNVIGYAYGTVEGYDYMALRGPAGVLQDIIVDPAYRGRGIGRRLLDAILAKLKSRDVPRVVLSTAAGNEGAQRLFAKAGFRRTMIEMTREL